MKKALIFAVIAGILVVVIVAFRRFEDEGKTATRTSTTKETGGLLSALVPFIKLA